MEKVFQKGQLVKLVKHDGYSRDQGWQIGEEATVDGYGRPPWLRVTRKRDGYDNDYDYSCFEAVDAVSVGVESDELPRLEY